VSDGRPPFLTFTWSEVSVRRLLLLAFVPTLTVLAQAPTPPAQPNAPSPTNPPALTQAEVDALVEKLGADDPNVRETAQRAIEAAGVRALAGLKKAINHPDPEVRRVLVDLVPSLEMQVLLAPRRVTLQLEGKSVQDALNEIARQTGYKIQAWNGNLNNPGHSFRCTEVPFWEALELVAKAGGLTLQQGYGDDTVRLQGQDTRYPFTSLAGPFRVVAQSLHQNRTIDLHVRSGQGDSPSRTTSMGLNFTVFSEPKLPIVGYGEARLTLAVDSERNSMVPTGPNPEDNVLAFPGGFGRRGGLISNHYSQKMYTATVAAQLVRPSERASSIKLLKGYIPLTVLTEQKAVEITKDLEKAANLKATVDTHTLTIQETKEQPGAPGNWQVRMVITNDSADNDYTWTNSLHQRIEVYGTNGERLQNYGSSWGNNGPNVVNITMTFRDPTGKNIKPQRLVFQSWTTAPALAPFEFRDVPLP
jgi:hypothetical protein